MLAYSYPLLGIFWTMLWFFLFFVWIWVLISVFADIFRSHDMSGWAKALWVVLIIVLPLIGTLIYLIVRGGKMHERVAQDMQQSDEQFRAYVQDAAGGSGSADQLEKLAQLRDRGVLTDAEFQAEKAKVLGSASSTPGSSQASEPPAPVS